MFSIHDFIMRTIKGMIGRYPDFQVMEYSLNWYEKGKLNETDLAEIDAAIFEHNNPPVMEEVIEDETMLPPTEDETV